MAKQLKKIKKDKKFTENELGHYLGSLQEHYNEQLKAIREGFDIMNRRFDEVDKRLDSHTEMIGEMKEDITIIKMDTSFLKSELKQKVDYDEFAALSKRVNLLEIKIRR